MATFYLKTGWTKHSSQGLFTAKGVTARDVLREKGTPAAEVGLLDLAVIEEIISSAMVVHPILVNRPVVATPKGVRLRRLSETVLELLKCSPEHFTKEDGASSLPSREHAPQRFVAACAGEQDASVGERLSKGTRCARWPDAGLLPSQNHSLPALGLWLTRAAASPIPARSLQHPHGAEHLS